MIRQRIFSSLSACRSPTSRAKKSFPAIVLCRNTARLVLACLSRHSRGPNTSLKLPFSTLDSNVLTAHECGATSSYRYVMASPPETHSTLEIDVTAQRENERQARLQKSNTRFVPKAWALVPDEEGVDAPQVAIDGSLPIPTYPSESAPQVIDTNSLPEPFIVEDRRIRPPRRICGLRVRIFWTIVAVAVAVIVAVAVGAGVGASRSKSSDSVGSAHLLRSSRLAAVNYNSNGVDFNCVYYQLRSGEIYLSVWNSSSSNWTALPVVTDGNSVLRHTPIAADVQWKNANVGYYPAACYMVR